MAGMTLRRQAPTTPAPGEDDDYMSMTIIEPTQALAKETYTQRRTRKQHEAEERSRPKSRPEIAAAAEAARDEALSTALPKTSKGFQMMTKLGFRAGDALGSSGNPNARTEPLGLAVKEDKGGVGMENARKRKFREETAAIEVNKKKQEAEEGNYRERVAREREERRVEGMCWGAMKVLEGFEQVEEEGKLQSKMANVLWRGLVRKREEKERERRMRFDLHQSLTRDKQYQDPEEDQQDRQALGNEEELLEEEDHELDDFLATEGKERLRKLVVYLRIKYFYCFWCKFKYEDKQMEGCPGVEEDDHD